MDENKKLADNLYQLKSGRNFLCKNCSSDLETKLVISV